MQWSSEHLNEALGGFRLNDSSYSPYKPVPWPTGTQLTRNNTFGTTDKAVKNVDKQKSVEITDFSF